MISMVFIEGAARSSVGAARQRDLNTQPSITDPKQPNHLPADGVEKLNFVM